MSRTSSSRASASSGLASRGLASRKKSTPEEHATLPVSSLSPARNGRCCCAPFPVLWCGAATGGSAACRLRHSERWDAERLGTAKRPTGGGAACRLWPATSGSAACRLRRSERWDAERRLWRSERWDAERPGTAQRRTGEMSRTFGGRRPARCCARGRMLHLAALCSLAPRGGRKTTHSFSLCASVAVIKLHIVLLVYHGKGIEDNIQDILDRNYV